MIMVLEVFEITPYSKIYGKHPRKCVFGKHGMILLGPGDDIFTGTPSSKILSRKRGFSKSKRWTQGIRRKSMILQILDSELKGIVEDETKTPLWVAATKPVKKGGPKRKGARATKKIEKLMSEGYELEPTEATAFRALSARGNYLGADRPDVGYSAKELCREFARPNKTSFTKLKRMARYLQSHRRLVYEFPWGTKEMANEEAVLDVYVDTDFAGCGQTRRSTSGGIIMHAGHCVKHWSVTQTTLSLSSGESELHGISKGASTALGMRTIMRDLGFDAKIRIHSDACAAIGIARRRGLGRVRHLDVEDLWIQGLVRDGTIELVKVPGAENPADILTKYVAADLLNKMLGKIGMRFMEGRSAAAPELPKEMKDLLVKKPKLKKG